MLKEIFVLFYFISRKMCKWLKACALMFVAVEAIDMDPGDLGKLTYTVSDPLFTIENVNSRTATIEVNG